MSVIDVVADEAKNRKEEGRPVAEVGTGATKYDLDR